MIFREKGLSMADELNKNQETERPVSKMAVTSIVIGGVALITSFIPIVNNVSFFFAALGIIFGIIGAVGVFKGKKRPKVLAIIALGINVLAIIIVLATQNLYGQAINKAANGPQATSNNSQTSTQANEVKVGETITLENKLELTVVSVEGGLTNYDGNACTKVTMKYINNGDKEISYNSYDWKAEDPNGAQTSQTIYSNGFMNSNADNLQSGKLVPGGSVTGSLYFKGNVIKVLYSANLGNTTTATWIV